MSASHRFKHKERCMFTPAERKKIIQIILKKKAFGLLKGNEFWKGIQGEFPNHTWHSLRNHYLRTMVPLLSNYKIAPEIVKRMREGASPVLGSSVTKKRKFSTSEDKLIIDHVKKFPNANFGGNKFWQHMIADKIIKNRSWSSVRDRYIKYLKAADSEKKLFGVGKKGGNSAQPSDVNANFPSSSKEPSDSEEMFIDLSDTDNFSPEDLDLKEKLSGTVLSCNKDEITDVKACSVTEKNKCDSVVQTFCTPRWPANFPPAPLILEDDENLDDAAKLGTGDTVPEMKNVKCQTDSVIVLPIEVFQEPAIVFFKKIVAFYEDTAPEFKQTSEKE